MSTKITRGYIAQLPLVPQVEVAKAWGLYMRMCMPGGFSIVSSSSPGSPMCRCAYMKPKEDEAMCSVLWTSVHAVEKIKDVATNHLSLTFCGFCRNCKKHWYPMAVFGQEGRNKKQTNKQTNKQDACYSSYVPWVYH